MGKAHPVRAAWCLAALAICTAGRGEEARRAAWRQVTSTEGRFAVEMPGSPTTDRAVMHTPFGTLDLHCTNVAGKTTGYVVFYSDYPERVVQRFTAERILRSARDAAVRRLGGKLQSEVLARVAGFPARRLKIEISGGGAIARTHLALAGRRLYQVTVVAPPEEAYSPEAERFLRSFRILR